MEADLMRAENPSTSINRLVKKSLKVCRLFPLPSQTFGVNLNPPESSQVGLSWRTGPWPVGEAAWGSQAAAADLE
jgi:hypothetical protein